MFVTSPPFEQFVPSNLVAPGQKCWRAVTLSLENPWYLFTHAIDIEGMTFEQTIAVAWESTLVEILGSVEPKTLRAISRMSKESTGSKNWSIRSVKEIWALSPEDEDVTGPLFLMEGDSSLRDAHMEQVAQTRGRTLLYKVLEPTNS